MTDSRGRSLRLLNVLAITLGVVAVVVTVTTIVYVAWVENDNPATDELEPAVIRIVDVDLFGTLRVPTVTGYDPPSLPVGEPVPLEYTLCSEEKRTEVGFASAEWVSEDGDRFPQSYEAIAITIEPGCVNGRLALSPPDAVYVENLDNRLGDDRPEARSWYIEGMTMIDGKVRSTWRSETFLYVNPETPVLPADDG